MILGFGPVVVCGSAVTEITFDVAEDLAMRTCSVHDLIDSRYGRMTRWYLTSFRIYSSGSGIWHEYLHGHVLSDDFCKLFLDVDWPKLHAGDKVTVAVENGTAGNYNFAMAIACGEIEEDVSKRP